MIVKIMDRFLSIASLGFLALMGSNVSAQNEPITELAAVELKELLRDSADISGAVVMGVQVHDAKPGGSTVYGYVPKDWENDAICARVFSANGLYEGFATYEVAADKRGKMVRLGYNSAYLNILEALPKDGLGLLVSPGACGASAPKVFSVGLWNSTDSPKVDLLLNSFRADTVFAYVAGQTAPVVCERIEIGGGIAYDARCALEATGLSGPVEIEIFRLKGGKPAPPSFVTIVFPEVGK